MTGPLAIYLCKSTSFPTYVIRISYIYTLEEWNEYATDNSSQDGNQDDVELNEEFFRKMCMEQYGHYVPFAWVLSNTFMTMTVRRKVND
jgi:uncharacterized sporulation protein YeaH/YhbH (DUF444 family)